MKKFSHLVLAVGLCLVGNAFAVQLAPTSDAVSPPLTTGDAFRVLTPGLGKTGTVNTLTSLGLESNVKGVFLGSTAFQNSLQPVTPGTGGNVYTDFSSVTRIPASSPAGTPSQIGFSGASLSCVSASITIKDSTGATVNSDFNRVFVVTGSAGCTFYGSAICKFAAAGITINAGSSSGSLFIKCPGSGSFSIDDSSSTAGGQPIPYLTSASGSI